ncbi:MAG: hypothetical protein ACI9AX_001493, partial [Polaromonas sp.]
MASPVKPHSKHSVVEDAQGLLFGSFICSASLVL